MSVLPRKTIVLFVAINERGASCVSESDAQDALDRLVGSFGGKAFRVVDIAVELPVASEEETQWRRRRRVALKVVG